MSGVFEGGTFTGTINGNIISGSWQNVFSESGSWSGIRKALRKAFKFLYSLVHFMNKAFFFRTILLQKGIFHRYHN